MILSVFFMFSALTYPFQPIQLSLIGALAIGFPSFVLALQPNKNIVRGNFTFNIIARAAPASICVSLNIILTAALSGMTNISQAELTTISVYTTALICMMLIVRLSIPFNALRIGMLCMSIAGFAIGFIFFRSFFMLADLSENGWWMLLIFAVSSVLIFNVLYWIADHYIEKFKNKDKAK